MKKFLPVVLLILVLAAAAFWFIHNQSSGTINEREGDFAVKDASDIFKMVVTDTENNKVELTNTNGIWMVNNLYAARPELIAQLMDAVTRVTSLCPVPTNGHDNVVRDLMATHRRIEIYDAKNNLLKSYWVGGATVDGKNTYMLLERDGKPAARPHMTYIPGFRGYLTARYNTDVETWRTRVVFNYERTEIKSLQVNYTGEPQKSFVINQVAADSFSISPADEKYRINEVYLQKYVRQYLDFYSSIYLEAYDNTYSKKDSMLASTPLYTITVTEKDNSVNEVKFYHMPVSRRSKTHEDAKGNPITYDVDHFHASIHSGKDFGILQYYVCGKLLRSYRDFFFRPAH